MEWGEAQDGWYGAIIAGSLTTKLQLVLSRQASTIHHRTCSSAQSTSNPPQLVLTRLAMHDFPAIYCQHLQRHQCHVCHQFKQSTPTLGSL